MNEITVTVCDSDVRTLPRGISIGEALVNCPNLRSETPVVAAFVNNEVRSLSYSLHINAHILPIYLDTDHGQRIYRRSLCYALAIAAFRSFSERRLLIGHSLGNAYYYSFEDHQVTEDEVTQLENELGRIVAADLEIRRGVAAYTDALEFFQSRGMRDAALLVERQNYSEIPVYRCGDFMDISHGPLVSHTGVLKTFGLEKYGDGFLLVFPTAAKPFEVVPGNRSRMLYDIYRQYKEWGRILRVSSVGQLNHLTESNRIKDFIRVAEALQEKRIAEIADMVRSGKKKEKVVLIAGPSSSGKTTFTKKLAVQLTVVGYQPIIISLDDYFVPRDQTPLDQSGNYDFEALEAINIEQLNDHLLRLFDGDQVEIPSFDFKTGQPTYNGNVINLDERGILLMEGIHGLNDELTPKIPRDRKFKIYVSALTQLNLDDHNRISTTDNRLIRRMVRDYQFRGHSAVDTLQMWPSVRRGENKNIFPFQDTADVAFNSALDYELAVLKTYVEPLLRQVKPYHDVYNEAIRLETFLRNFTGIPDKHVPTESILREFIGDSGFHY